MQGSGGGHPERRGQVILVAAIGIALTLITMGMVLSAVAIPQQWWSAENVDSVDGVQSGQAVVEGYGSAMFYSNFENRQGYVELRKEFAANGRQWRKISARLQNEEGNTVNTSVVGTTNGSTIMQGHFRNFTSRQADPSEWTVVKNAKVRRFSMNVTPTASGEGEDEGAGGAFRVVLQNATGETTVSFVPTGKDESNVTILVDPPNGESRSYSAEGPSAVVDFTEYRIEGEKIVGFPGMSPPFTVRFENPTAATGRYVLVTNKTGPAEDTGFDGRYHDFCAIESPCADQAIYSANVRHSIDSAAVAFNTTLYVAPEDPGLRFPTYQVKRRVVYFNSENGKMIQSIKNSSNSYSIKKHVEEKPQALGPARHDLDHSQGIDIPYLDESQSLRMVEASRGTVQNSDTVLLRKQGKGVQNGLIGVGDFDRDGNPEVYYNEDGAIFKVNAISGDDKKASLVRDVSQLKGVVGVSNIDSQGKPELIYTTKNQEVKYIQPGEPGTETILNASKRIASGRSIGSPADFDTSDEILRIPVIRNDDIYLVSPSGTLTRVVKNPDLQKSQPIAPADIDHDGEMEIVFASQEGLKYVEYNKSKSWTEIETHLLLHNGDPLNVKKDKGTR